jgi:hypothetical protein
MHEKTDADTRKKPAVCGSAGTICDARFSNVLKSGIGMITYEGGWICTGRREAQASAD